MEERRQEREGAQRQRKQEPLSSSSSLLPRSHDGFSLGRPCDDGQRGRGHTHHRVRSVGDIEELTRMERILDEWTPYASLNHVHDARTQSIGGREHSTGGGRGYIISGGRGLEGQKAPVDAARRGEGHEGRYGGGRVVFPDHNAPLSSFKGTSDFRGTGSLGMLSEVDSMMSSDSRIKERKGRGVSSVEGKIARKREENQMVLRPRKSYEYQTKWLSGANNSDEEYTEQIFRNEKTTENADSADARERTSTKGTQCVYDDILRERKLINKSQEDSGDEHLSVKRGIRFWDGDRKERDGERERKIRIATSWKQRDEEKCVREEEWIYREEDTVWVRRADRNTRLKNQKERMIEAERNNAESRGRGNTRQRMYDTPRGMKDAGSYWRIGYGERGIGKELKVVRINDEQLTSF